MSGIEKIIQKLDQDASLKAQKISDDAKKGADDFLKSEKIKYDEEAANLIKQANEKAAETERRAKSMGELETRKMLLKTKQDLIDSVFENVHKKMCEMPDSEYFDLLKNMILSSAVGGERLILSDQDKQKMPPDFIESINKTLSSSKKGEITLSDEKRNIEKGFVLTNEQSELNFRFDSIVKNQRELYEADVVKALFGTA